MNLLLVGNGKWAQNYISTLTDFSDIQLKIANRDNWKQLVDEKPDGVIVCTPPSSHIEIAEHSLQRNIPAMIEKPLSLSYQEASALKQYRAPVLVNHIHLFSTAYQHLKRVITPQHINSIVSLGFNKGPVREYSGLWDYGCHDLSMILDLMNGYPSTISASEVKTKHGSLFNIKLKFGQVETESLVGNGGEKRVRKLKVGCDGLKLVYDDKLRPSTHELPLANALKVFLAAIGGENDPRLGMGLALDVLKILEECQNQL
jgi:hypothetical protein